MNLTTQLDRPVCLAIVLIGLFESVSAQNAKRMLLAKNQTATEIEQLVGDAAIVAPELGAKILLDLVESRMIHDKDRRTQLLYDAYRLAGKARNPFRMRQIRLKGIPADTRAGYLSYAFDQRLDGLSLRSRVISQMLDLDKALARQQVFEINGRLGLKPLNCEDALVYDVESIYETVTAVGKAAFSRKEIDEGVRALFLANWLEALESPSQIGPALSLLSEFQTVPIERQILTNAMSRGIAKNFKDDRSFTFAIEQNRLASKVYRLTTGVADQSKTELSIAFRDFLGRNLKTDRCSGNEIEDENKLPPYLIDANLVFPDKPLTYEAVKHTGILAGPKLDSYWQSEIARRLNGEMRNLRAGHAKVTKFPNESTMDEWLALLSTFLANLDMWDADSNNSESDVFNQKCVLYRSGFRLSPSGVVKDRKSVV